MYFNDGVDIKLVFFMGKDYFSGKTKIVSVNIIQ